jgi:hypothetical protein
MFDTSQNKEKKMKQRYLTILTLILFSLPLAAYADHHTKAIDGDKLQEEAEKILKSEPDAKKVTVKVEVAPKNPPNENSINFDGFDLNGDGVLARDEVGEKLFQVFDRDRNHVIDNIEMKKPSLIVFTHMEKTKIEIIDYQAETKPTKQNVSHQEFLQASKLSRFDKNEDGLSPLDFLEMPFNQVNVKDDAVIDMYEWKRAYAQSVKPLHMENFHYNN